MFTLCLCSAQHYSLRLLLTIFVATVCFIYFSSSAVTHYRYYQLCWLSVLIDSIDTTFVSSTHNQSTATSTIMFNSTLPLKTTSNNSIFSFQFNLFNEGLGTHLALESNSIINNVSYVWKMYNKIKRLNSIVSLSLY